MGAPHVLTAFMLGIVVVFMVAYGYRLRSDVYLIGSSVLSPYHHRLVRPSVWRRLMVFIGMPLDGVLYVIFSMLPWAARTIVLASLVTDAVAEEAGRSGLSWEETRDALARATLIILGDEAPEVNRDIVKRARRKFEANRR